MNTKVHLLFIYIAYSLIFLCFFCTRHGNAFAFDLRFVISAFANGLPEKINGKRNGNSFRIWKRKRARKKLNERQEKCVLFLSHCSVSVCGKRSGNVFHHRVHGAGARKLFEQGSYLLEK